MNRSPLTLLAAIACLALAPSQGAAQSSSGCPRLPAPQLKINLDPGTFRVDNSQPMSVIKSLSNASHELHSHVLGLSVATIRAEQSQTHLSSPARSGNYWCASMKELIIDVKLVGRTVYIASEVQNLACLREFIRVHEYKHVAVDEDIVNSSLGTWQVAMRNVLKRTHLSTGRTPKEAQAKLEAAVDQAFNTVFANMRADQTARQAAIDNGGDYERLNTVCNGVAQKLLSGRR